MELETLDRLVKCDIDKPILTFIRNYNVTYDEAKSIFQETIKWLWIGQYYKGDSSNSKPKELAIYPPLYIIDEMWHCFILCTREYIEFCEYYFGSYVHHSPSVGENDHDEVSDFPVMVSYVIEHLGVETAKIWFGSYAIKYDKNWFIKNKRF